MNDGLLRALRAGIALALPLIFVLDPARADDKPAPAPVADPYKPILDEYRAKQDALSKAIEAAKDGEKAMGLYQAMSPDDAAYSRRLVDLAVLNPGTPQSRDAMVWVLNHRNRGDEGPYGDEFARAAALLVRHHGDDPEAIRIGLDLDNVYTDHRDSLLHGFMASAKGHESRGLARLALAQYLEKKASIARGARKAVGRPRHKAHGVMQEGGTTKDVEFEQPDEAFAYATLALRECDPDFLAAEAERLYEEVASEYGDVRHVKVRHRELAALLVEPNPTWNGRPLTPDELAKLKALVETQRTLADEANAKLNALHNLVAGKPAPAIEGIGLDGRPLKLSDYKGKGVALAELARRGDGLRADRPQVQGRGSRSRRPSRRSSPRSRPDPRRTSPQRRRGPPGDDHLRRSPWLIGTVAPAIGARRRGGSRPGEGAWARKSNKLLVCTFTFRGRRMLKRNGGIDLIVTALAVLSAAGWIGGFSLFGFRTPFWDVGLLPLVVAMIVGLFRLGGPRGRFLIGFEACGAVAILCYVVSCSGPARWSPISALLPFQSAFWLDPEMEKSGVALSPWKIVVDGGILACIPLISALIGGLLVSTRITLRRAMILIAAIAVALGIGSAYLRRARYYDEKGQYHRSRIVGMMVGSVDGQGMTHFTPSGFDRRGKPLAAAQRRLDAWHEAMALECWKAARYPWVTASDEQPPE